MVFLGTVPRRTPRGSAFDWMQRGGCVVFWFCFPYHKYKTGWRPGFEVVRGSMWGSEQCGILRAAGFGVDWDSQEEFLLKLTILLTEQLGCSLPRWERKGDSA